MLKKILFLVLYCICYQCIYAQKKIKIKVEKISKEYLEYQNEVKAGKYYQNQFKVNANNLKHHLGIRSFDDKYHTLDEKYIYQLDKKGDAILRSVEVLTNLSIDESVTIEYKAVFFLDKEGYLIYHVQSQKYSADSDAYHTKIFYNKEKAIQLHLQGEILNESKFSSEHKKRGEDVSKEARYYSSKFYKEQLPAIKALTAF